VRDICRDVGKKGKPAGVLDTDIHCYVGNREMLAGLLEAEKHLL
jgi:hypothetical protein